ncbi:MAG: SPOR domain-containing protein [Candidatus Delongbacteria bacterium]|nr:SPOR domain-containing protein [Candidatus Delongbacteria bacterium]MBN2837002.1 SPOR domain-containing protein [Candidatus Delongbacteria bacterium]
MKMIFLLLILQFLVSAEICEIKDYNSIKFDVDIKLPPKNFFPEMVEAKEEKLTTNYDSVYVSIDGFRIQLYKTSDFAEAKEKESYFREVFIEDEVVLIFEEPFYKIRVGNYKSRNEADIVRIRLEKNGFRNGLVVPDKINILKLENRE